MCAKCSFIILKKEETFRMRVANLDYRNKQWFSLELHAWMSIDNNELCSVLTALINSFICKVLEYI